MSKDYQINYTINVKDLSRQGLASAQKNLTDLNKAMESAQKQMEKNAKAHVKSINNAQSELINRKKAYTTLWVKELDKREKASKDFEEARRKANKVEQDSILAKRKNEVNYTGFWNKELDKRNKNAQIKEEARRKASKAEADALIARRRNEIGYTSFWKNELDSRDRIAEKSAQMQQQLRDQERQRQSRQASARIQTRGQAFSDAGGMARSGMMYVAAPAAVGAVAGVKSAMSIEQMKIGLNTQFGEDGPQMYEGIKNYALQTAFSLEEAVTLLKGLKLGASNLGVKSNTDLLSLTKSIGNVLIGYGASPENREEITNQISQVAMSDVASTRQDLRVMQKRGLPVFEMLKEYTGMNMSQLEDKYGKELPSKLIIAAIEHASKSPKILAAMIEQSKSLTQAWGQLGEQAFLTSGAFGKIMDKSLGIKKRFHDLTEVLQKMSDKMEGLDNNTMTANERMIGFGAAAAIAIPTLTAALIYGEKLGRAMFAASEGAALFRSRMMLATSALSLGYLAMADWKTVMDDINKDGIRDGLLKHIDLVIAAVLALNVALNITRGLLAITGMIAAAPATVPIAAVTASGAGIYGASKAGSYLGSEIKDKYQALSQESTLAVPNAYDFGGPTVKNQIAGRDLSNLRSVADQYHPWNSQMAQASASPIILNVENHTVVDWKGSQTTTKVKRNGLDNPVASQIWYTGKQ